MIESKQDLNIYLKDDMPFYHQLSKRDRMMCQLTDDPLYEIAMYVRYLRMEEYYFNCRKDRVGSLMGLWYFRKKNKIGNRLGIKIPKNTFGPGLMIYHHGEIIVNETARIGAHAQLHGGNCIGNNGKDDQSPIIGDYLDMGIGARAIGNIQLGSHVTVGANAVVTSSFSQDNITLVGIPARLLEKQERE